jgi:hypothetical protein
MDLRQHGARVWLDILDAQPGRYWTRSIEQALSESEMMIVIISPAALESMHVMVEWQAYLEARRPVLPVLAAPCELPEALQRRHPVSFTRPAAYQRAVHQVTTRLIDYGTRIWRSDPVIWSLGEDMRERRDHRERSRETAQPACPETAVEGAGPPPAETVEPDPVSAETKKPEHDLASTIRRMASALRTRLLRRRPPSLGSFSNDARLPVQASTESAGSRRDVIA